MAGTDLDRALLGEDLTSKVTLQNVASLSPVQLAVVAARDDLERQVQNRACTAFLRKKAVFDAAGGTEDPSQDGDFLNRAALRFRQLATEYQAGRPITQVPSPLSSPSRDHPSSPTSFTRPQVGGSGRTFAADSCSFSWGDELARTIGPVEVKLEEDELVIAFKNQPLFNILASKLCFFLYLEGESQGEHEEMTLQLEADDALMGGTTRPGPHFNLRLFLGKTPRDALSTLTAAVETWRQRFGFLVSNLPATPTPSEGFAHIPLSPVNITFEYSLNTTHPSVPDPAVGHATPASGAQVERNAGGTARSQAIPAHLLQPLKDASGPFRYLSPSPAPPGWTAGFWVRLFAILRAVCPQAGLCYPNFTLSEIKLLSRRTDIGKLPELPDKPCPSERNHSPVDRLGLEQIYRARNKLTVNQSRNVLLTADYPDLRAYAHTMGKIVDARNVFLNACDYILRQDSAIKHLDSPCKLSKKHLDVVCELRESEV
ncbi:hypothetical protein JCM8115_004557 [Rhodotorula mucilaginosa]